MLVVDSQIRIPLEEFQFSFSRSSGPGGQNVNKVNSKVTLHWDVTNSPHLSDEVRARFVSQFAHRINVDGEVVITSQRYRDQHRNRSDCLEKLRQLILLVRHRPKRRKPTRPGRAARERRLRDKHRKSDKKRMRQPPTAD